MRNNEGATVAFSSEKMIGSGITMESTSLVRSGTISMYAIDCTCKSCRNIYTNARDDFESIQSIQLILYGARITDQIVSPKKRLRPLHIRSRPGTKKRYMTLMPVKGALHQYPRTYSVSDQIVRDAYLGIVSIKTSEISRIAMAGRA